MRSLKGQSSSRRFFARVRGAAGRTVVYIKHQIVTLYWDRFSIELVQSPRGLIPILGIVNYATGKQIELCFCKNKKFLPPNRLRWFKDEIERNYFSFRLTSDNWVISRNSLGKSIKKMFFKSFELSGIPSFTFSCSKSFLWRIVINVGASLPWFWLETFETHELAG